MTVREFIKENGYKSLKELREDFDLIYIEWHVGVYDKRRHADDRYYEDLEIVREIANKREDLFKVLYVWEVRS